MHSFDGGTLLADGVSPIVYANGAMPWRFTRRRGW